MYPKRKKKLELIECGLKVIQKKNKEILGIQISTRNCIIHNTCKMSLYNLILSLISS